ncbi:MAG: DUF3093 domain-containing protein [Microbacteriaceae bacterium]|nr:DUF3093 domain-containing protein [Microbacteriaceae bacterium]
MQASASSETITFTERVYPSIWSLAPTLLLTPAVALVAMPFMPAFAAFTIGVFSSIIAIFVALGMSTRVTLSTLASSQTLRVGRSVVDRKYLGKVTLVESDGYREALGPGLSALAHVRLQAGVKTLVQIEIQDPQDVTPYWLFSCRNGSKLKTALEA